MSLPLAIAIVVLAVVVFGWWRWTRKGTIRRSDVESDERRQAEDTHPDEPSGNGETASEPYEPEREEVPDEPAESKPAEDPEDRAQEATDDGMGKRTQPGQ